LARATGLRAAPARQSSAAYNLLSQIDYAIDAAVDAYDLAARLKPVLSAAVSLPYEEYATIAATVSVAQSSFQYWATGYPSYYDALRSEYGACADRMRSLGYSSSYARDYCMGTSSTAKNYTEFRRPGLGAGAGPVALMFVRATPRSAQQCPTLGAGYKSIGRGDAKGAFTGAWAGAFTAGVEGAILGAIVGGGGASAATALGLAWDTFWYCGPSGSKAYK
jgi:hypothetical protein